MSRAIVIIFALYALLPLSDFVLPGSWHFAEALPPIFIFSILGLGLNILTGYTGLLNLGIAAFMAIGAYSYAILTCDIYPFQWNFWCALVAAFVGGGFAGILLGLPTMRLRGDYLAIVTLGFGEIVQDSLKNLEVITKGTQGINPLPAPTVLGLPASAFGYLGWYYLLLMVLGLVVVFCRNLETSRAGRVWMSLREDEIAACSMGIAPARAKLLAFACAAALAATAGALWASYLGTSGEPGNYDFQISIIALCMVIVGGLGSIAGVLVGAVLMVGFNSVVLVKLSTFLAQHGYASSSNVFSSPNNWKYLVFGFALILAVRYFPRGLLPASDDEGGRHVA